MNKKFDLPILATSGLTLLFSLVGAHAGSMGDTAIEEYWLLNNMSRLLASV